MKHSIIWALIVAGLMIVSCYGDEIQELNNRVDKIENEKISTVQVWDIAIVDGADI